MTSVREEASRRRYELKTGLELGVDDYIEKPITTKALLIAITKHLPRT